MKTTIILGLVMLMGVSTAYGAIKLQKGVDFAQIGIGSDRVTVTRIVDGDVTCYVSRHGEYGSQAISCVK